MARVHRAPAYARLGATVGRLSSDPDQPTHVQLLNITQVPEQTPSDSVEHVAAERVDRLGDALESVDVDATYTVEGHVSRDVAFDILRTAREDGADRILMGYAEDHPAVAEEVEYDAPCDTPFVSGIDPDSEIDTVNVGTGGGPHHEALLPLARAFGENGASLHVIDVEPVGSGGTTETLEPTLAALEGVATEVHEVDADSVAEGLVATATDNGGVLLIGATRTRLLRRWVFGSTPDRVIGLADEADLPVLVYAHSEGLSGWIRSALFDVYRPLRKWTS